MGTRGRQRSSRAEPQRHWTDLRVEAAPIHSTAKNWSRMGRRSTTACQRDWLFSRQTGHRSRPLAKSAAVQLDKEHEQTSHAQRIGRNLRHAPRAVWDFPLQDAVSIVTTDGFSDADAAGCPLRHDGPHLEAPSALDDPHAHWQHCRQHRRWRRRARHRIRRLQHGTLRKGSPSLTLQQHVDWVTSGSGAFEHMETEYFWLQQDEKNNDINIHKIRGTINPADVMTKRLDEKRLSCGLLSIKHIGGRQSSAPQLILDSGCNSSVP